MSEKKLIGRGGLEYAPGRSAPLGYWPENLDRGNGGWTGQSWAAYRQALQIAQRYHINNTALALAEAKKQPPPDLGDPATRNQLARKDLATLQALSMKLAEIDGQISKKQATLKASSTARCEELLRQEPATSLPEYERRRQDECNARPGMALGCT